MREAKNVETIQALYAAFARGDLSGILSRMDETIVFAIPGSPGVPLSGVRRGLEQARRFFEDLERQIEFSVFEPRDYVAQGNRVVALVHYEGRNRTTGKSFSVDSAMLWTLGNGKALRFLEYTDTEALAKAAEAGQQASSAA